MQPNYSVTCGVGANFGVMSKTNVASNSITLIGKIIDAKESIPFFN